MSKGRRGGYNGGGTVIRASVEIARERTEKHVAKVQRERQRFAAEQTGFEQDKRGVLIKADSLDGRKKLLEYEAAKKKAARRAKNRAERKALRNLAE